jgi:large subunit ribosomal protein L28
MARWTKCPDGGRRLLPARVVSSGRVAFGSEGIAPGLADLGRRAADGFGRLPRSSPATLARLMAKVCHSCGKGPAFGNSRSHSMVATKRRFDPNLQKVRILVGKAPRRVYVCTRCLKAGKVTKAL